MRMHAGQWLVGLVVCATCVVPASASTIRVAVASNFKSAAVALTQRFEADSGHGVTLIFGSTGKHYAQIYNGAPFDVFLAADAARPALLEAEGLARAGSRFTYALGTLVLWSSLPGFVDPEARVLEGGAFRRLAIANPRLAPYGAAAEAFLRTRGLWESLQGRLVRGENVAQAFQFVHSGNAELGLVAYSQVKRPDEPVPGSLWVVPRSLYAAIEQQAVVLREGDAARAFVAFLQSDGALALIREYGYETP